MLWKRFSKGRQISDRYQHEQQPPRPKRRSNKFAKERKEEEERQRRLKEMEEEQRRQEKLQKELKFKEEMVCIRRPVIVTPSIVPHAGREKGQTSGGEA